MARIAEYETYDALGLAKLVREGDVSAEELLDEAIERTEKLNPTLNAVILKHFDKARQLISDGLPDGPFRGVPFLLKDLHLQWSGTVTSYGSRAWKDNVATFTSTLIDRYLRSGLVIFGKTNSPEMGLIGTTEPRLYGPTPNPWNLEHSCGGSSGGAAVAVASGILPLAHASDGGGSIRIPASSCGLFGFKPTRARTPAGPQLGEGWGGMSTNHAISRSVRDSAALLDATTGAEPGDPYAPPASSRPYLEELTSRPDRLRIAVNLRRPDGSMPDQEVQQAIMETAKLCEELGHIVVEAAPEIDVVRMGEAQLVISGAYISLALQERSEALGREIEQSEVENITWMISKLASRRSNVDHARNVQYIHKLGRVMGGFMGSHDVYLTPVLGTPPPKLGVLDMMTEDVDAHIEKITRIMPYTGLFNMTGQPSMSVPLHWTSDGLPVGSMFTGRFGDDSTLFRLAAQLEEAKPWNDIRPNVML